MQRRALQRKEKKKRKKNDFFKGEFRSQQLTLRCGWRRGRRRRCGWWRLELVDLLDLGSGRGLLLSATVGSAEVGHAAGHTAGGTAGSLVELHDDGLG